MIQSLDLKTFNVINKSNTKKENLMISRFCLIFLHVYIPGCCVSHLIVKPLSLLKCSEWR